MATTLLNRKYSGVVSPDVVDRFSVDGTVHVQRPQTD